jgi:hypothetical protein
MYNGRGYATTRCCLYAIRRGIGDIASLSVTFDLGCPFVCNMNKNLRVYSKTIIYVLGPYVARSTPPLPGDKTYDHLC